MNRNTLFKIICLLIFIFNVKLASGQTSSEVIQAGKIKIQKETDDLISANKTLNLQLVKLQNEEVAVIKNVKDSVGYEKALLEKNHIDSTYNGTLLVLNRLKEICRIENRLDSLNHIQKINLSSYIQLTAEEYIKKGYPIFRSDETLYPNEDSQSLLKTKPAENIEGKLKQIPEYVTVRGWNSTNKIYDSYSASFSAPYSKEIFSKYIKYNNFSINDSIQSIFEAQLYKEHTKRSNSYNFASALLRESKVYEIPKSQISEEVVELIGTQLVESSYLLAIQKDAYIRLLSEFKDKLDENCSHFVLNTTEIENWKDKDYLLIKFYNARVLTSKISFYQSIYKLEYLMFLGRHVKPVKTIKPKNLDSAIEQFNFKLLSKEDVNKLIETRGEEIQFFNRFFDYSEKLKVAQGELDKYTSLKNNSDKTFNGLVSLIQNKESGFKTKIQKISEELARNTIIIDSKEKRVSELEENERSREQWVVSADKKMIEKDYSGAIRDYETAQHKRVSKDIEIKIKKAQELNAPILAKKQEEETQRNREIEANRLKENEDWHSEDVLKNWLLEAPFYNYEKTVKVEFKQEYVENFNIGSMIWVYVNGNKEGELIKYKLRGSPHNTFIDIKWIRTGKIESVINVVSSSEKVMKSKRGSMTGIGAIKNGSNLRREGCSFD